MESGGVAVADEVAITLDLELIKNTKPQATRDRESGASHKVS